MLCLKLLRVKTQLIEAVSNAKNIGTMMTELQKALPKDEWFDGVMQLDDFGSDISAFGQGLLVTMLMLQT